MKTFFASLLGTLAALMLAVVGGFILLIGFAAVAGSMSEKQPAVVESGSFLVFDLNANINDAPPEFDGGGFAEVFGDENAPAILNLRQVTRSLRAAATDGRIKGVLLIGTLSPDGYGTAFPALREIRAALAEVKAAGKPVLAYLNFANTRDYYLAAGATQITLDPYGTLLIPGLASEPTFYAGAFEKFGIGVQVTKHGGYKSYAEPFVRKDLSPENREQMQKLLNDLWSELVNDIAADRKLTPAAIQAIVDAEGSIRPEAAQKAGLVDRLAYRDTILADLKEKTGRTGHDEAFKQVRLADYAATLGDRHIASAKAAKPEADAAPATGGSRSGKVALIYAEGAIVDGEGKHGEVGGAKFSRELRKVRQDPDVKAIVIRVNSPGGSVSASEHIQREIVLATKAKPVVVSMGGYAASGGYWISTHAKRIFAEPTTITGSIGVVGLQFDIKKLGNDLGFTWDGVKTAKHADLYTITRPKTPEELAIHQRTVDWVYEQFIGRVVEGRKLPDAEVRRIAEGRVWSGVEALKLKLVDEIGGLDAALDYAAAQAGLAADYRVDEFPRKKELAEVIEAFLHKAVPSSGARSQGTGVVSKLVDQIKAQAATLDQYNDPRGVYARLPFELTLQ